MLPILQMGLNNRNYWFTWEERFSVAVLAIFLFRFLLVMLKEPIVNSMNFHFSANPIKQANTIILYPSIITMGILVLLNLPVVSILSITYPLCTPLFVLSIYLRIRKDKTLEFKVHELKQNQFSAALILFIVLLGIVRMFSQGINL